MITIVAFDRKHDLVQGILARPELPVVVFDPDELAIALLEPPAGILTTHWAIKIVDLVASTARLMASQRLLLETLQALYAQHRPSFPTLRQWKDRIRDIRAHAGGRQDQYREASYYTLHTYDLQLGEALNYTSSSFLEQVFNTHGCFVIRTGGLSAESASLLASVCINWAYESRGVADAAAGHPIIFVLDDALPLISDSASSESERGTNPIATWALMARGRNIGFIVSAQNFSLISPALRNNANTIVCCGAYGRDGEELARHLSLTREQAAMLSQLQPGEVVAVARSVWPLPLYGRVPEGVR